MLKINTKKIKNFCKKLPAKILTPAKKKLKSFDFKKHIKKIHFSWKYTFIFLPVFLFAYYVFGAYLMHNVDKNIETEISKTNDAQSETINALIFLINKETSEHLWTPNMPIIFPGYILDNMPEFQKGELKAAGNISKIFAKLLKKHLSENIDNLDEAAQYLSYSPDIWFFAKDSSKIFAPSSSTQYSKAKRSLSKFSKKLEAGTASIMYITTDLEDILKVISEDLRKSSENLKQHIREHSDDFFDFQADNIFYYTQGQLYTYYIIINALGDDYQNIIVNSEMYSQWTTLQSIFKNALQLEPSVIRNANINSSFSPNHLAYLDMFVLDIINQIRSLKFLADMEI